MPGRMGMVDLGCCAAGWGEAEWCEEGWALAWSSASRCGRRGLVRVMQSSMSMCAEWQKLGWGGAVRRRFGAWRYGAARASKSEINGTTTWHSLFVTSVRPAVVPHLLTPRLFFLFPEYSDSDSSSSFTAAQLLHSAFPPPPTTFGLLCRAPSSPSASMSQPFLHPLRRLPPPSSFLFRLFLLSSFSFSFSSSSILLLLPLPLPLLPISSPRTV